MIRNSDNSPSISLNVRSYLIDVVGIIALVIAAAAIQAYMFRNGVIFQSHDIATHIMWLQHFSKQIAEGIWYPRWLAGTNYGYGSPDFVFYPPLVYYLGSFLRLSGLDIQKTIATLFLLASLGSGFSFYLYGRTKWGKITSYLGALAYMTSPYLVLNIYTRGALAEAFALIWIPLGLLLTDKAIGQPRWRVILAIFFGILALTHMPSLLVYLIFWLGYTLCFLLFRHSWKAVVTTLCSAIVGLGTISFYLLPALLEKKLVNIDSMRNVSGGYRANLIGTSIKGINVVLHNYIQPIFLQELLILIVLTTIIFIGYRQNANELKKASYWVVFLTIVLFLMTYPSILIWQSSKTLQMVQFPWRLLGLLSFGRSALFAIAITTIIQNKSSLKFIFSLATIAIFLVNAKYSYELSSSLPGFNNPGNLISTTIKKPQYQPYNRHNALNLILNDPYSNKSPGKIEYLPLKSNGKAVPDPLPGQPPLSLISGKASMQIDQWDSYNRVFNISATEKSLLKIRTYYYPAWHLYVNEKPHAIAVADDGTIEFKLDPGSHTVQLRYLWTNAFKIGMLFSFLSLLTLIIFWFKAPTT
jgi:6-pyruvoyl-tetrahydropterin synthase related domain